MGEQDSAEITFVADVTQRVKDVVGTDIYDKYYVPVSGEVTGIIDQIYGGVAKIDEHVCFLNSKTDEPAVVKEQNSKMANVAKNALSELAVDDVIRAFSIHAKDDFINSALAKVGAYHYIGADTDKTNVSVASFLIKSLDAVEDVAHIFNETFNYFAENKSNVAEREMFVDDDADNIIFALESKTQSPDPK